MSTSTKTPASIRQGGPGASHENAKQPLKIEKPPADDDRRSTSHVSGGGGERDSHHTHDPKRKMRDCDRDAAMGSGPVA